MKLKFKSNYQYSFDGINITSFKSGEIHDIQDETFCKLVIERGYAIKDEVKKLNIDNKKADIKDTKSNIPSLDKVSINKEGTEVKKKGRKPKK